MKPKNSGTDCFMECVVRMSMNLLSIKAMKMLQKIKTNDSRTLETN